MPSLAPHEMRRRENKITQTFLETFFQPLFLFRNFYFQSTSAADYFPVMTCLDFDGKISRQLLFLSLLFSFHPGVSSWCGDDDVQNGKQTLNWTSSSRKAFPLGVCCAQICINIKAWPEVGWFRSLKEELSNRGETAEAGKRQGRTLRVPDCNDLLSQFLAHSRVLWRAFRGRVTRAGVSACSTMLTDWKLGSQMCNSCFISVHKNAFAVRVCWITDIISDVFSTIYRPFLKARPVLLYLLKVINTFMINKFSWVLWEPNGKMTDLPVLQM